MIKHVLPVFGLAALTVAGCATTENEILTQQEAAAMLPDEGETSDGRPFRCERIQVTGTRFTERVCYTEEEWQQMVDDNQAAVRRLDEADRSAVRPADFGGPGG